MHLVAITALSSCVIAELGTQNDLGVCFIGSIGPGVFPKVLEISSQFMTAACDHLIAVFDHIVEVSGFGSAVPAAVHFAGAEQVNFGQVMGSGPFGDAAPLRNCSR